MLKQVFRMKFLIVSKALHWFRVSGLSPAFTAGKKSFVMQYIHEDAFKYSKANEFKELKPVHMLPQAQSLFVVFLFLLNHCSYF